MVLERLEVRLEHRREFLLEYLQALRLGLLLALRRGSLPGHHENSDRVHQRRRRCAVRWQLSELRWEQSAFPARRMTCALCTPPGAWLAAALRPVGPLWAPAEAKAPVEAEQPKPSQSWAHPGSSLDVRSRRGQQQLSTHARMRRLPSIR